MLEHKEHFHGSDLEKIEAVYHIKKEDIVSFSANVNPLGISFQLRSALSEQLDAITSYPDREYTALRTCIAAYAGTVPEHITVGNGSTELISLFIQIQHPKKALILGPTYSEYEREITLGGGETLYYPLEEARDFLMNVDDFCGKLSADLDLIVLCNPNNPTSTAITEGDMQKILEVCLEKNIFVMTDETYVEFADPKDHISSIRLTESYPNLIILRGTSKFFAAPGLRLGYAVTGNRKLLDEINTRKNPWSINSLAEIAGRLMFQDSDYIEKTRTLMSDERERLYQELSGWDSLKVYRPMGNFMLCRILKPGVDADMVFEHCIKKGLMIRNCCTFPYLDEHYFRFCFMSPKDNDRLIEALREIL